MLNRHYKTGMPELLDEPIRAARDEGAQCIWCGRGLDGSEDGASFFFLGFRDGTFGFARRWLPRSHRLEGHQFYCHAACFRATVPEEMQPGLSVALDED